MKIISTITEVAWERAAVAIGKFEGLHIGHQKLIRKITEKQRAGFVSVAFTFDQSPRTYFGEKEQMLFTKEERRNIFAGWNLSYLMEYPFTKELADMEAEQFVEDVLCKGLHAGYLAVGPDFCFGKGRKGNVELLQRYAKQNCFLLEIVDKEKESAEEVSSTRIRNALEDGQMTRVNNMLGFPFFIRGEVVKGNCLGRKWGIPTANLEISPWKLLPPDGVYFSCVKIDGMEYRGITNLGKKPTIGEGYAKGAETYIYGFEGDIYGKTIQVELVEFHREECRFASVEQLVERLKHDVECGRKYFGIE